MPSSTSVFSLEPWNSAGYSRAPAPTMVPWPFMRRGTECTVPIPPGLVSETDVRGLHDRGLAADFRVVHVLAREVLQHLHDRPADEVGERDLAATGPLEV